MGKICPRHDWDDVTTTIHAGDKCHYRLLGVINRTRGSGCL